MARRWIALALSALVLTACSERGIVAPAPTAPATLPWVLVEPGSVVQVSAGANHSCALKTDGQIVCWGQNEDGESLPPVGQFIQVTATSIKPLGAACGATGALPAGGQMRTASPMPRRASSPR